MKQWSMRGAALALALVLGVSPLARASEAMGNEIQGGSLSLSVGTGLTKQIFWSDTYTDLRQERYLTYKPNSSVKPQVSYGTKVLERATLTTMAKALESQGKRVVGGINGDYYTLATGEPVGMVVSGGVLRSSPPYHNSLALGFRSDGTAFLGQPALSVTATFGGYTLAINGGVNKVRTKDGGYTLLTDDFSATTQNVQPGVDVILTPILDHVGESVVVDLDVTHTNGSAPAPAPSPSPSPSPSPTPAPSQAPQTAPQPAVEAGISDSADLAQVPLPQVPPPQIAEVKGTLVRVAKPAVGGRVSCTVEQVLDSTGPIAIPPGKMVLTINRSGNEWLVAQLLALQPGATVEIDTTSPDARWNEASEAVGALYKLVTGGKVEAGLDKERTARSAVGLKADGSAVFYTMDGKQPGYSIGATLSQVAMRLVELGCVEAVCLDGGGSTTLGATYPDGATLGVVNKPADGQQRPNSTALFLTTEMTPTGALSHLSLTPNDTILLSGANQQVTTAGVDTAYYQMGLPGPVAYSIQNGDGLVSTSGVFTAGSTSGVTQVTATCGAATGTATMTVVKTPDKIGLTNAVTGGAITALTMEPNQKVDLNASAVYRNLSLVAQDTCFVWTVDPAVGTVDANGVFTAGPKSGTGTLTVAAGTKAITLPVAVAGHVVTVDDFEAGTTAITGTASVKPFSETRLDYVRYGQKSLKLEYDAAATGTASVVTTLAIQPGERYLGLWVYGDGSGNSLTATLADGTGATHELVLTGLDFTGWKQVLAPLPENTLAIRTVNLIYGGTGSATGVLWLDQLTTANEALLDGIAPGVKPTVSGGVFSATVTDNVDSTFAEKQLTLSYDGAPLPFTWDGKTATMKATLPADDGRLHRLGATATDRSGNLYRASADLAATAPREPVFTDMAGHWSLPNVLYLYDRGVTTGMETAAGLAYQPEKPITRGEFFLMAARWMKLDFAKYEPTVLPFSDGGQIPGWALGGVKAMYALGILKGSMDAGVLRCNAEATITRAEAMTILGRIQPKGYVEAALPFADAGQVPSWALSSVKTLVGQGVVGGYENQIRPLDPVKRSEVAKMLYTML